MCVEWNVDNFGLDLTKSVHFDADMCKKTIFTSFPVKCWLWPLVLKFAPLVTLDQLYVSTKLEVFTDFPFQ